MPLEFFWEKKRKKIFFPRGRVVRTGGLYSQGLGFNSGPSSPGFFFTGPLPVFTGPAPSLWRESLAKETQMPFFWRGLSVKVADWN